MVTYLMPSKVLYLLMDWETSNQLLVSGHVRGVIKALQRSVMVLLTKIVSNVTLKMSTVFAKRCIYVFVAEFF